MITPALYTNTKAIIEKQREFIETEAKESEMEKGDKERKREMRLRQKERNKGRRKGRENCRQFPKKPE